MGWIVAVVLICLVLFGLLLLPVRVALALRQRGWRVELAIDLRYAFIRWRRRIDVSDKVAMALEHMWKRWRAKGEPVQRDLQESVDHLPRRKLLRLIRPALRMLGRATECSRLHLTAEVGGYDAMESALLAGLLWSGGGMLVGAVDRWVRLVPTGVGLTVRPNYQQPICQVDLDCILAVRLGKAMRAMIWLGRQALIRKEIVAWIRDSLRRKGDQSHGRTPDRGPNEGGNGKP